ncbi:MAG: helix-turn-helix transcriptional regulator [Clostridia bacterium]|nr:helix-turn-helix transcriptional regulator [Clostridia bacterium]
MKSDVTVTKIENVYYQKTNDWHRNGFKPRIFDGAVLFKEGEIEYYFQNQTVVARKGDLLLLPGKLPYGGKRRTDRVAYYVLDFTCLSHHELVSLGAPLVVQVKEYDKRLSEFQNAVDIWNRQTATVNLSIKSFLFSMLGEVNMLNKLDRADARSEEIVAYIADHFCDPQISVKMLCQRFFISESQLRRNLRKTTGSSPNDYISTLRINKAKNELAHTDKTIKQISAECGFSSPYYFSRCFSDMTKISPTEYRTLTRI